MYIVRHKLRQFELFVAKHVSLSAYNTRKYCRRRRRRHLHLRAIDAAAVFLRGTGTTIMSLVNDIIERYNNIKNTRI